MSNEIISLEEVIKYAIMSEKECCVFYRNVSKLLEGGRLHGFFNRLAEEELNHLDLLMLLIEGGKVSEKVLHSHVVIDTDVFETLINESWNPYGLSEEQLLYLAGEREKIIIEAYERMMDIKPAPLEVIKTAEKIKNLEKEHLERITTTIHNLFSR